MIAALFARLKGILAAAGLVLALVITAFLRGRAAARRDMAAEIAEAARERREVDHDVDALGPADVDRRLSRWVRRTGE